MRFVLLLTSTLLVSCQQTVKYNSLKYRELEMSSPTTDVTLPTKLWSLFEAIAPGSSEKPQTEFVPLKVYLYERNHGILGGENHLLIYPAAGGELDLRDFVTDKSGSYYLAIVPIEKSESSNLKTYFLSNSVERKLGDDTYGSGCDSYFDVTSAFASAMKKEGFLLNTTAHRDVSALAGTFFFVAEANKKLNISRLTIKDSRYPELHCKR